MTYQSAVIAAWAFLVGAVPAAEAAVDLVSHRAAYRLSLLERQPGTVFSRIQGGLVIEWRATCEGATTSQRLGFVADDGDGEGFSLDIRFSSWESADDRRMRFHSRTFDNGRPAETFEGSAELDPSGGGGVARYTEPEPAEVPLPPGTVFPTEHMRQLIESAKAGRSLANHIVFDGSDETGLSEVTAFIGSPRNAGDEAEGDDEPRWPVSLAYHDIEADAETPAFELAFDLAPGGIFHDLVLGYDEFSLKAELESLELLDEPACG